MAPFNQVQDGIYIRDFPRSLTGAAPIPAGGRADLLLRCPNADAAYPVTWDGTTIATATQPQLTMGKPQENHGK